MSKEKELHSSDTLERSNLSSLQSDLSSTKKSSDLNSTNDNPNKSKNCFHQQHTFGNMKFVPCPMLNSNFNSTQFPYQCPCVQLQLNGHELQKDNDEENIQNDWQRFNGKWPRQNYTYKKDKNHDVKSKNQRYFREEMPFQYCDILEGIPKKNYSAFKSIIENPMKHRPNFNDKKEIAEKIEIYYFDHGNSAYYHTTDIPPILATEKLAEKTNSAATRFWAEIFGYIHIAISLLTAFVLQFLRCILFTFIRPLTVGVIQLIGDYFIKPVLSITFNGIIQPILILLYNIATSFRDCCEPLAAALGFFMKEVAMLFRSCRLVEITHNHRSNTNI